MPETLGLWIADFHFYDDDKCDLVVAKNSDRRLKTQDSRRILPLDLLLDRQEFADLRTCVEDRRALAVPSRATGFMFGHINGEKSLRERDVKGPLGKVLHHVTGAPLTVHHLRHSFASYLLTTLILPDDDRCVRIPDQFTTVISYERKRALAERLLGSQKLGQHSIHALSESMGHIVSSTTLRTYSHLLDLTLCHYVSQPSVEAMLPAEEVRKLTGQNKPTATTPAVTASKEVTGYQRPPYPTAPLDGVKPGSFQVSQVRGRRASRMERSLRASKLTLKRVRVWTGKPVASTPAGPDWREIALSYSKHNSHFPNELWRASAKALDRLKEKSGGSRHFGGLQISGSAKWLKLVDHHWQSNLKLNKEQRKVLFHVIEKWNYSKCGVLFSSRPMAVVWRDILKKLKFQESQVRISLTGKRFENRSSELLHRELAIAGDLPGTSAKRGWRGSILIRFFDEPGNSRHLKSAGHFIILMLAIKEGYGLAKVEI